MPLAVMDGGTTAMPPRVNPGMIRILTRDILLRTVRVRRYAEMGYLQCAVHPPDDVVALIGEDDTVFLRGRVDVAVFI
jgi:hypothetical protein